ncbi:MAG: histidinol-phosphatase HisJ family protein [Butyrivibrio sp.]|nr:histidinol-phosphatase HisJ family protein [Butyrivibrio sp.]
MNNLPNINVNYPADYHMHSHNSGDSKAPMEDMILSAIQKGLKEICFTEHMDLDYPPTPDLPEDPFVLDIPSYKNELYKYKEKYKDQITVKYGIEIGMQTQIAGDNAKIVANEDFDFVIASIHLVDRNDPFYPGFWDSDTVENIYRRFFSQTLKNIKLFTDFDVLGHLDYISRYAPKGDTTYSYERFKDQIDEILIYLVENGKGLDVNSKVLGYSEDLAPNPCPEALRRFHELGGKIITFGSDAHRPDAIACGFPRICEIAREAGFTEYYTFDKRVPTQHKF